MADRELPDDVVEEAERLTRLARRASDENAAAAYRDRRDELVGDHGFDARVREDEEGETLVCYPREWLDDGTVRVERIEDTDRAVEVDLSGPDAADEWEAVEEHNREVVEDVREEHGEVHAANAAAFADFMGNHRSRRVETATAADVEEFLTEYFVRNAWPSEKQREVVERSLRYVFDAVDEPFPGRER